MDEGEEKFWGELWDPLTKSERPVGLRYGVWRRLSGFGRSALVGLNQAGASFSLWLGLSLEDRAFYLAWIANLVFSEAWLEANLVACSFVHNRLTCDTLYTYLLNMTQWLPDTESSG